MANSPAETAAIPYSQGILDNMTQVKAGYQNLLHRGWPAEYPVIDWQALTQARISGQGATGAVFGFEGNQMRTVLKASTEDPVPCHSSFHRSWGAVSSFLGSPAVLGDQAAENLLTFDPGSCRSTVSTCRKSHAKMPDAWAAAASTRSGHATPSPGGRLAWLTTRELSSLPI